MPRNEKLWRDKLGLYAAKVETQVAVKCLRMKKDLKYRSRGSGAPLCHVTCYAVGNAGDTALSECVRRTFNQELGTPVNWRLETVYQPVDERLIERINATQALIIGGGGLFLPDTNNNSISGWQWACSKESLNEIKVPIVLYSVGYNYFRGQEPSELFIDNLNAIIEKSVFVGLRNHGSVEAVKVLLREPLREKVCYQPCTTTLIRRIMPELPPKKESGKIAFNFAFDRAEKRYGGRQEEILRGIVKSMYLLRDKGYDIYVVAHCVNDLSVLSEIQDRRKIHAVNATAWDLPRLARFYNEMDVVLGMRGHAQMIPFGVNCHIISLSSHVKMRWFLEDIGAEDWYVELTKDVPSLVDQIVEKFTVIHERRGAETTQRIMEAQDKLLKITEVNMQSIKASVTHLPGGGVIYSEEIPLFAFFPGARLISWRAAADFSERRSRHAA